MQLNSSRIGSKRGDSERKLPRALWQRRTLTPGGGGGPEQRRRLGAAPRADLPRSLRLLVRINSRVQMASGFISEQVNPPPLRAVSRDAKQSRSFRAQATCGRRGVEVNGRSRLRPACACLGVYFGISWALRLSVAGGVCKRGPEEVNMARRQACQPAPFLQRCQPEGMKASAWPAFQLPLLHHLRRGS